MTRPIASAGKNLQPIIPDRLYPLAVLKKITGVGDSALGAARRRGLPVRYTMGRAFVFGADFIAHVLEHSSLSKPGATAAGDAPTVLSRESDDSAHARAQNQSSPKRGAAEVTA